MGFTIILNTSDHVPLRSPPPHIYNLRPVELACAIVKSLKLYYIKKRAELPVPVAARFNLLAPEFGI